MLDLIGEAGQEANVPTYLVGGYVRDLLLDRIQKPDVDVVCVGSGIDIARKTAAKLPRPPKVSFFKNFGTAQFHYEGTDYEFVGARKESYDRNSRKPVVEDGSLEDDQNRRDFTINALAIGLNGEHLHQLIDPFDGVKDLERALIRTPLNPDVTYSDDPLRMMRALRFSSQLGFSIDEASLESISRNRERIKIVSMERISVELNKIILSPIPSIGFRQFFETGMMKIVFPEMARLHGVETVDGKSHKDNLWHTLQVLDNLAENTDKLWLRWAAVLHDIAKPPTKRFEQQHGWTFHGHEVVGARMVPKIFRRMKLPLNEKMKYVQKLVNLHLRPISLTKDNVTDSAIRRLLFDAGDDIDDLMMLCRADITSKNKRKVRQFLENYDMVVRKLAEVEEKDRIRNWQPPIDGEMIMQTFGLKPGREIGIIKNAIREAILEGDIPNEFEAARKFMLAQGKDLGLTVPD